MTKLLKFTTSNVIIITIIIIIIIIITIILAVTFGLACFLVYMHYAGDIIYNYNTILSLYSFANRKIP